MIENSPFLAMNSFVPSSGSTNQQRARLCASPCEGLSSATMPSSGKRSRRPRSSSALARRSASVTGSRGDLHATPKSVA